MDAFLMLWDSHYLRFLSDFVQLFHKLTIKSEILLVARVQPFNFSLSYGRIL
jgi:hypothetical protein